MSVVASPAWANTPGVMVTRKTAKTAAEFFPEIQRVHENAIQQVIQKNGRIPIRASARLKSSVPRLKRIAKPSSHIDFLFQPCAPKSLGSTAVITLVKGGCWGS